MSYLKDRKPISNLKYVKQDFGPTPKPSQFLPLRSELIDNGEIQEIKTEYFGRVQKKYIPMRAANLSQFSVDEIVLIDKIIASLSLHNGSSISSFTHTFIAWKIANTMDELPLNSFLLTSKMPTDSDILWAKEKISQYQN